MSSAVAESRGDTSVSLVITCFNHGRFLADAIESALQQKKPFSEIIVIDDGSTDDTRLVAQRYPNVRYSWQTNRGLSAARNAGLRIATGRYIVFLDADDRLTTTAVARGLACMADHPACGFVYGHFRWIDDRGLALGSPPFDPCSADAHADLLQRNLVGMHATVLYRRDVLLGVDGFDETLRACEDYDLYLKVSRSFAVASHEAVVAEYRKHGGNMSNDPAWMLQWVLKVLEHQRSNVRGNAAQRRLLGLGVRNWKRYYGGRMAQLALMRTREQGGRRDLGPWLDILRRAPQGFLSDDFNVLRIGARAAQSRLPAGLRARLNRRGRIDESTIPVGSLQFGDLRRLAPLSRHFGFDRGLPIDRYFIEGFLKANQSAVRGCVLEIGGNEYTRRFGGDRVISSDVLSYPRGGPETTYVADLTHGEGVPDSAFDCIIMAQTLHLIFDVPAAIRTLHRILKPGGTLLLTVPGTISQIEQGVWRSVWYWGFTRLSLERLLNETFDPADVDLVQYGNVLASIAFLEGLAASELKPSELDHRDELYPLLIGLRATRAS